MYAQHIQHTHAHAHTFTSTVITAVTHFCDFALGTQSA
jgi:hypothetical protein